MKTYAMTHNFHFMLTVKAAEPESIRQPAQRAPAPNRPRLKDLACINSKKWDKGGKLDIATI